MFIIYHFFMVKCKIFCKKLAFGLKILYLCTQLALCLPIINKQEYENNTNQHRKK